MEAPSPRLTPPGVDAVDVAVPPALPPAPGLYRPNNDDLPPLRHLLHPRHGLPPPARTRAELRVLAFQRAIKEKTNWVDKVADDSLVERWVSEAFATTSGRDEEAGGASGVSSGGGDGAATNMLGPPPLTRPMLAAAVAELRADADRCAGMPGGARPSGVELVWVADELVPPALAADLVTALLPLEARPADWHPGSDSIVRDLLHPSLYCYVRGVSRVRDTPALAAELPWADFLVSGTPRPTVEDGDGGGGGGSGVGGVRMRRGRWGKPLPDLNPQYQWLPSTVGVAPCGGRVDVLSHYLVGLHPVADAPLYRVLERLLAAFVPLFEAVLTDASRGIRVRYPVDLYEVAGNLDDEDEDEDEDDDDDDDLWERRLSRRQARVAAALPLLLSEMATTPPPSEPPRISLNGRKLRVIVKVSRIELNSGRPTYPGGVWHLEGVPAEGIAATGIYYYENTNTVGSRLAFRTAIQEPSYEQNDEEGVATLYGLRDEDALNQPLGSISTGIPGRCLAFPNIQHRVLPFGLADPSKPGRRSIVAFFLVDPTYSTDPLAISADTVPPQDADWYVAELEGLPAGTNLLGHLPPELLDGVVDRTGEWMSIACARRHREGLMAARAIQVEKDNGEYEAEFSLCEH